MDNRPEGSVISRLSNPLQAQLLYAFDSEQASSREKVTGLSEAEQGSMKRGKMTGDKQKGEPWLPLSAHKSQITSELLVRQIRELLRDGPEPGRRSAEL